MCLGIFFLSFLSSYCPRENDISNFVFPIAGVSLECQSPDLTQNASFLFYPECPGVLLTQNTLVFILHSISRSSPYPECFSSLLTQNTLVLAFNLNHFSPQTYPEKQYTTRKTHRIQQAFMLVVAIYYCRRDRSKAADSEMLWQVQESQVSHASPVASHRASTCRRLPAHVSYSKSPNKS